MLRKIKSGIQEGDVDSELEKLAKAIEMLTPEGRGQLPELQEQYQNLRDIFGIMSATTGMYSSSFGDHSRYSIGTFVDDVE